MSAPHDDQAPVATSEGPRSPDDAMIWAHDQCGETGWSGMCLSFVRTGYNLPGVYASASDAWRYADRRHETTSWADIPVGAPTFFEGSNPDGHVAFYNGDGDICTTNSGTGYPLVQPISTWLNSYGYRMLGWSEDLNGYHVIDADGGSDVPDSEVIVPYDHKENHASQKLAKNGDWKTLEIDEDGATSLIYSPGGFAAMAHVYVTGLPVGATGKLRFVIVETDDDGTNGKVTDEYPAVEYQGTSDTTQTELVEFGKLGKSDHSGKTLRLRLQASAETDKQVTATLVAAKWFH